MNNYLFKTIENLVIENDIEKIDQFFTQNAEVERLDIFFLREAAAYGKLEILKYLQDKGTNLRAENDYAFSISAKRGHLNCVKYLVKNGANLYVENSSALRESINKGHYDVVNFFLEHGIEKREIEGRLVKAWSSPTPLFSAENIKVIDLLCQHSFLSEDDIKDGLIVAGTENKINVISYFAIEHNMDINFLLNTKKHLDPNVKGWIKKIEQNKQLNIQLSKKENNNQTQSLSKKVKI